jgi:hypothetical protein
MPPRLSASGLWRAERCPASTVLPRIPRLFADAEAGQVAHAERERPGDEVAMAWNVEAGKGRLLAKAAHRAYGGLQPGEIPGTADRVTVSADKVTINDYKSGFGYMVAAPKDNPQLLLYAVAAADIHGKQAARVEIEAEGQAPYGTDLDSFDLAAARERIRAIWTAAKAAETGTPRVVAGDHCWRCECAHACPAYTTVLQAVGAGAMGTTLPDTALTPRLVADTWPIYQLARRALGMYEQAVRHYVAAVGPVPLSDGRELALRTVTRESLDGRVARSVLRDLHGEPVADAACEVSTSKAAVERAIGAVAPRGAKAPLVRTALEAIRAANGVTRKHSEVLEAVKPEGALPAHEEAA